MRYTVGPDAAHESVAEVGGDLAGGDGWATSGVSVVSAGCWLESKVLDLVVINALDLFRHSQSGRTWGL